MAIRSSSKRRQERIDPDARERALDALALSRREGISLTRASRLTRTTRRTTLRYAGAGFRHEGRRYVPRAFDRIPREMTILTPRGPESVVVRDSRAASKIARQANAINEYLRFGDVEALATLRREAVTVDGHRYTLILEPDVIDRLAEGGELHYELYRR